MPVTPNTTVKRKEGIHTVQVAYKDRPGSCLPPGLARLTGNGEQRYAVGVAGDGPPGQAARDASRVEPAARLPRFSVLVLVMRADSGQRERRRSDALCGGRDGAARRAERNRL